MADYGALLSLANGATFITPQSTPLCLYATRSFSSRKVNDALNQAVGSIPVPDPGQPVIPFVYTSKPSQGNVGLIAERSSTGITVTGNNVIGNGYFTMTVLVFTFFEQPMPNPPYGMAVWDEAGKLILTHESKVLTDIETVGTRGSTGGISLNVTKPGRWAIVPDCSGQQQWQFSSGGPGGVIMSVNTGFAAEFNGSSTQIHSALLQYPGGSGQMVGAINAGNTVTAIDVSNYI